METKGVWAISMAILLVFVLSSEQATTSFITCFDECNNNCLQRYPNKKHECGKECVRECGGPGGNFDSQMHHCNLSCSIDQCAQFGQDAEAVKNCLDNCKKSNCNIEP